MFSCSRVHHVTTGDETECFECTFHLVTSDNVMPHGSRWFFETFAGSWLWLLIFSKASSLVDHIQTLVLSKVLSVALPV